VRVCIPQFSIGVQSQSQSQSANLQNLSHLRPALTSTNKQHLTPPQQQQQQQWQQHQQNLSHPRAESAGPPPQALPLQLQFVNL
jgi:hypothetical protein